MGSELIHLLIYILAYFSLTLEVNHSFYLV